MTAPAQNSKPLVLSVYQSKALADLGDETLLRLAAASPEGSEDPVDQALNRAVQEAAADVPPGTVEFFEPADTLTRYSLATVRGARILGEEQDVVVMRGDAKAVGAAAKATREERVLYRKGVQAMTKLGHRSMGVAVAPLIDGEPGEFRLKGFVTLAIGNEARRRPATRGGYTRVEMWPAALRFQHWANLLLILVLTVTGYYIMQPFFGQQPGEETGFFMGWIRFIHFAAGFGWIVLAVWRLCLTIFASTRQMRWRSLWPIYNKQDLKNTIDTAKFYMFLSKEPPTHVGHNGLQQITYTAIYGLCIVQILTGLALYGLAKQDMVLWVVLSYPVHWFGIATFRLIHAFIMFIIWAFVILHVYLCFRADALEHHGGVSAMINGGVWLPTGSRPVDAPEVE